MTHGLTAEDIAALSAPLDKSVLKKRKGQGGKEFTYAPVDYLEDRLTAVDPAWNKELTSPSPNVMFCAISVHGTTRSGSAGYYIPDVWYVWDKDKINEDGTKGAYVEKLMSPEEYNTRVHTLMGKAEASAFRRACRSMGKLGAELWDEPDDIPGTSTSSYTQPGFKSIDHANIRYTMLVDLGVPENLIDKLNNWSTKDQATQQWSKSQLQLVLDALVNARKADGKDMYNSNKLFYVDMALTKYADPLQKELPPIDPD